MLIFAILALVIAVLAVILALQNTLSVTVSFLAWQFEGSLALVLLLALIAGMLISFLAYLPSLIRGNLGRRSLRKRVSELETALSEQKKLMDDAQLSLDEQKQRLQEAQLRLQVLSTPAEPTEGSVPPSDESAASS